jgi:hypothetical protein
VDVHIHKAKSSVAVISNVRSYTHASDRRQNHVQTSFISSSTNGTFSRSHYLRHRFYAESSLSKESTRKNLWENTAQGGKSELTYSRAMRFA